jgi:AraC family transcriptional regulator of adaptative response / DNA-3-methyladenine glycosylase II
VPWRATLAASPTENDRRKPLDGGRTRAHNGVVNLPDRATCRRIFTCRDERYDGRIFVGVKTTRVYCRPVCRVRAPKAENCTYFNAAVAAQAAGFRPCLRCRPETAPLLAAWNGTSTTVDRALGLIAGGALDDQRIGELAARLGVGERHLRRLFAEHLGTTPIAVVQTRRVLFAKKLITDTTLPMAHIALAAGFSSVRRFNETMRAVYDRPPTELRRTRASASASDGTVTLSLPYAGPYDWPRMSAWFGARAIGGVEGLEPGGSYVRSIFYGGEIGTIEIAPVPGASQLRATIRFSNVGALLAIVDRIRRMFDLDADVETIGAHLSADPRLAPLVALRPGLRVPGAWDGYELAVRAVLGQQISVDAATSLAARLVSRYGEPLPPELVSRGVHLVFPRPERLAEADIASLGMPRSRAETIRTVAKAAADDPHCFLPSHDLTASIERLRLLRGIGDWTAHYIAMRALREPDAFPTGDVGLLRAFAEENTRRPTARELTTLAEGWRPWRAYAAIHLWAADGDAAASRKKIA